MGLSRYNTILLVLAYVLLQCHAMIIEPNEMYKYTCMAARNYYKLHHTGVDFGKMDPVFHYETVGRSRGYTWPIDMCNDQEALYPDDPLCNCTAAIIQFKNDYPFIKGDPFAYWESSYRTKGTVWHCEKCPVYFQESSAKGTRAVKRAGIPDAQQCVAARLDYWIRVPAAKTYDPVYYYNNNAGTTWSGSLCDTSPIYIGDSICQCDAAKDWYKTAYPNSGLPAYHGNPYNHYLQFGNSTGTAWHCELCPDVVRKSTATPRYLSPDCVCMAARISYSERNPSIYDPVYYYQTIGINSTSGSGNAWDCDLCNVNPVNIDDPICNCEMAKNEYIGKHPESATYYSPFLHYWNNYLTRGFQWRCERCLPTASSSSTTATTATTSTTTTIGGTTTGGPTDLPFTNDARCTCLAARFDYLSRYPDVVLTNTDPVYHFTGPFGVGHTWRCDLCVNATQQLNKDTCNCPAAIARFVSDVPESAADPWEYYIQNPVTLWHCELCTIPNVVAMDETCNCLAASMYYLLSYPNIQTLPNLFDPAYHYKWFGHGEGKEWRCDLCNDRSSSHYMSDSVCNCPEAKTAFLADYPLIRGFPEERNTQDYWTKTHQAYGNVWRCSSCSTIVDDPSTSLTCNCTAGRLDYRTRYNISIDPWDHFINTGKTLGNKWDCQICNDTCAGSIPATARAGLIWAYPEQYIPSGQTSVTILPGCYVPLRGTVSLTTTSNIIVLGVLRCDPSPSTQVTFNTKKLYISGSFECGSATNPLRGQLEVILNGVRGSSVSEATAAATGGNKNIVVLNGGRLLLHGAKLVSWTKLAVTANPGDSTIQVVDPVDWVAGDIIVIGTTKQVLNANRNQTNSQANEIRTIDSIDSTRTVISLTSAVSYQHHGEAEDITFSAYPIYRNRRAEVGLITRRNIVIRGDELTPATKYGAQVIIYLKGQAYVSGVEISQAGQKGLQSRFPFQWYQLNDIPPGQYFRKSTIVNSYNRCVVVSSTNNTDVSGNFCYNFFGSGYVLETGAENGVTMKGNLALHSIRPDGVDVIGTTEVAAGPRFFGPASFLITNPNNTIQNNIASDGVGTGFWLKIEANSTAPFRYRPQSAPYLQFDNNLAHSHVLGFSSCPIGTTTSNINLKFPLHDLQIYNVLFGLFGCGPTVSFNNLVIADAQFGSQVNTRQLFNNTAWIGYVDEPTYPVAHAITYDYGDMFLYYGLFQNYEARYNSSIFGANKGWGFSIASRIAEVTLRNSQSYFMDAAKVITKSSYGGEWATAINCLDQSLIEVAGQAFVPDFPLMYDNTCNPLNGGYSCPYHYIEVRLLFSGLGIPNTKIARYEFDGTNTRTTVAENSATLFPTSDMRFLRLGIIGNVKYVYQIIMPVTSLKVTFAIVSSTARFRDVALIEVHNTDSFTATAPLARNCADVYSKDTQSYYFDKANNIGCFKLIAANRSIANDAWSYSTNLPLTIAAGTDESIQPIKPYTDEVFYVQPDCQCIAAFVSYWNNYPEVLAEDIDPAYHFQYYGGPSGYSWDCSVCRYKPHYINESFCNCTAASQAYNINHTITNGWDSWPHYLLYQLSLGYGYHCEYCPVPLEAEIPIRGYSETLSIGLGAFTGVGVLLALFSGVVLTMYWNAFAKHGPFYCSLIIIGVLLSYVAVFTLLPEPTDPLCLAFPWFLGVAFSLVYGCLFIKTWALYQVWRNAKNFQRSTLTPSYIMKGILLYLGVEIGYLVIWFAIDPPAVHLNKMIDGTYQAECASDNFAFWIVFVAVKFVWLLFGAVLSFLTRNMVKEYNESKSIAYAIYNIVLLGIIGGPVVAYVQATGIPGAVLVIEVVLIVLAFTFTLLVLFGGIIYGIFFPPKDSLGQKLSNLTKKDSSSQNNSHSNHRHTSSTISAFSDDTKFSASEKSGVSGKTPELYLA